MPTPNSIPVPDASPYMARQCGPAPCGEPRVKAVMLPADVARPVGTPAVRCASQPRGPREALARDYRVIDASLLTPCTAQNILLGDHVERVSVLAAAIAKSLHRSARGVARIRLAGKFHDLGKAAIPEAILDKPGPLDEKEWEFIRHHPLVGERIALASPDLKHTAPLIRSSHERIDGHGYPDQLAGRDIPLGSRIIAVCDAYDAMTSDRVYRPAISIKAALRELKRHADTQFDATIVKAFCAATELHQPPRREPPSPGSTTLSDAGPLAHHNRRARWLVDLGCFDGRKGNSTTRSSRDCSRP